MRALTQDEIRTKSGINRRDFFKLGAGLVIAFYIEPLDLFAQSPGSVLGLPQSNALPPLPPWPNFNAFLKIAPDGRVTCAVGKVEMGQGLQTALAQNMAEELEVSIDKIDMIMGDTDLCPWDIGTFGSMGNRILGPAVRAAAAEAKNIMLQMAAERFIGKEGKLAEVSLTETAPIVARLQVADGVITDPASGKKVSYGELVGGKRIERKLDKVSLKAGSSYKVMGKSARRKDGALKVTGQAKYAADFTLPGMLFARIVRPPAHGATLKLVDTSAAEKMAGVNVVRDGELIAVLAPSPDVAEKALAAVRAQFEPSKDTRDNKNIFEHLLKTPVKEQVIMTKGDLAQGEKQGQLFEQTYYHGYGAHAHMEMHTTLATVEGGKATLWVSTQRPFGVRDEVAKALGFKPQQVHVITPYVGGGFGGKNYVQNPVEAARLSKAVGKPVQLVWERGEDFFYDRYRPAAVIKLRTAMTPAGKITSWDLKAIGSGDWGSVTFYDIPNHRTIAAPETGLAWRRGTNAGGVHPFNVGAWRMPGTNTLIFAMESHMDQLAAKARMDPLAFRLKHLGDKRMQGVLQAAAKQFGYKPSKRSPSGRGIGLACGFIYKTYVATIAEVDVDKKTGEVRVKRVVAACDPGTVVNPEGAKQQVEGCITMGVGYALTEEVQFAKGEVLTKNFDSYDIPKFSNIPKMEIVLIDNRDIPPDGMGEPPIITMGAAIANAVYDKIGVRLFQLPMTPDRVKEALHKA